MNPPRLARSAWPAVPTDTMVLLPVGSTEQHGPHLPLNTDSTIAAAVANEVAVRLERTQPAAAVTVAPTMPYGASGEHQAFPGTISIGHDALIAVLVEQVRSLATWAGRVVVVNGHGGNVKALATAVPQLIAEHHDVAWVPCTAPQGDAHAGHVETSLMLHLAPETVDLQRAGPGNTAPVGELVTAMLAGGVQAVSASGVLGDPTTASADEGARLLDVIGDDVYARVLHGTVDARGCLGRGAVVRGDR